MLFQLILFLLGASLHLLIAKRLGGHLLWTQCSFCFPGLLILAYLS